MGTTIIFNASSVNLTQNVGTLPFVGDAMWNWFQPMVFTTIVETVVNSVVVQTPTNVNFNGVWQVFTDTELAIRPEGERDWSWFKVHSDPSLSLKADDVIYYLGIQYRVMYKRDWTSYGYNEYGIILDFRGSGPNP